MTKHIYTYQSKESIENNISNDIIKKAALDIAKDLNIPVAFNFPSGHTGHNVALKMGAKVRLNITSNSVNLYFIE